jgi:hypothetical protein
VIKTRKGIIEYKTNNQTSSNLHQLFAENNPFQGSLDTHAVKTCKKGINKKPHNKKLCWQKGYEYDATTAAVFAHSTWNIFNSSQ